MLVVHGTADRLVLNLQAEVLVEAMEKPSPVLFSYCHGGGHNLYFGLTPQRAILLRVGEVSACLKTGWSSR
jgi:hypothetical protein